VLRGHDGTMNTFSVQQPAFRQSRREERILQLMRICNTMLDRKTESRRRDLSLHVPAIVPLAPQTRLLKEDDSMISLLEVYEDHCGREGMQKDDHIALYLTRMKEIHQTVDTKLKSKVDLLNLKTEVMDEIKSKMIPEYVLSNFMARGTKSSSDLWTVRKRFTMEMAATTFLTYVFCIGGRSPGKLLVSRKTGAVWTCDIAPSMFIDVNV
jgi:transformation/transcription domain-associated protein